LNLNTSGNPGRIQLNYQNLQTGDSNAEGASATVGVKNSNTATAGANPLLVEFNGTGANRALVGTGKSLVLLVQTASATVVSSSVNPSVFGRSVTFTATVSPASGSGTPTGTVTLQDNGATLGTSLLSGGSATFVTTSLGVGTHAITVFYSGDAFFTGSGSGVLSQTIKKDGTNSAVVSSTNPSVFGQNVNFTATVNAKLPGSGTPTGTVTFLDGASTLGTASLSSGKATLKAKLAVGTHNITISYGGDANFNASTSATLTQTVNKDATTTVVTSSLNPSVSGQAVTFTATVTANTPGSGTPGGAVTFLDGSTTLGIRSLSSGKATFTTSSLSTGVHSITAVYHGNSSFTASTSATLHQTVNAADVQLLVGGLSLIPTLANEGTGAIVSFTRAGGEPVSIGHQLANPAWSDPQGSVVLTLPEDWSPVRGRTKDAVPFPDLVSVLDLFFAEQG
jgi:hypothetical protein